MLISPPPSYAGRVARLANRLLVLLLCATGVPAGAQTRTTSSVVTRHFHHDVWRQDDGLPTGIVASLMQSADGYLWIEGLGDNVSRFDGVRFTRFLRGDSIRVRDRTLPEAPRLRFTDRAGRIFVTYEGGKVVRYEKGRLTTFVPRDSIHTYGPETPAPAPDGSMWAVFKDELWRWRDGVYSPVSIADLPKHRIHALQTDAQGMLYVGYSDGRLLRTDGRTVTPLPIPPNSGIGRLVAIDDSTLVAICTERMFRVRNGRVDALTVPDSAELTDVTSDGKGGVWVATRIHGLWHLDANDALIDRIPPSDLASAEVRSVFVDREGSLWVGTVAGLERFRRVPFESYAIDGGVAEASSAGIAWADSMTFFTFGHDGLIRRVSLARTPSKTDPNAAVATVVTDPMRYTNQISLRAGSHGTVWVTFPKHVDRWSAETGKTTVYPGLDSAGVVYDALEARDGTVWAMTTRGLYRLANGRFVPFVPQNVAHLKLPRYHGYGALFEDSHQNIWAGSGLLLRVSRDSMAVFSSQNGLPGAPARAMYEDSSGTLWFSTGPGRLLRVRGDHLAKVRLSSGDDQAESMLALSGDRLGNLWIAGNGITRIPLADLNAVADGRATTVRRIQYNGLDGLPSLTPVGESRALAPGPNGTLWAAFDRSLLSVDPAHLPRNDVAPSVTIEALNVDEHGVSLDSAANGLAAGSYRSQLQFTATSLLVPSRMRFRYMLEGAEKTWAEATGLQRTATYTRLAPGTYKFHVQASNNEGVWNTVGSTLAFRVLPAWYQTWWAMAAGVLLIAGAAAGTAWGVARMRQSRSEARLHAMMEERSRMAREIHDTLLQGFTGVTLQLHALKTKVDQSPQALTAGVERLLELSDATLRSARQAVWEMRPPDLENADLAAALGAALERASDGWPAVRYDIVGTPRRLEPEMETAILRIAIEAATNAAKHANAKSLSVQLSFQPSAIALTVWDDGQGFLVDSALAPFGTHFGLVGMRERARRIGADVTITSELAAGTKVALVARDRGFTASRV